LHAVTASRTKDWKAAAWLLEHSPHTRDRYGARVESDADSSAVQVLGLLAASFAARAALPEQPVIQLIDVTE